MRNKVVYLSDVVQKTSGIRSKYYRNKESYVGMYYNDLYLKDIIVSEKGEVLGVCDCECGTKDLVTGIFALVSLKTKCCNNCMRSSCTGKIATKYNSDKYIGKVYGYLKVIGYYSGKINDKSGVIWDLECLNCGATLSAFAGQVVNGTSISCGCIGEERNNKYSDLNILGQYINGTRILEILPKDYSETGEQFWRCECKYCGKSFIATARSISSCHTSSCGCLAQSIGVVEIAKFLDDNSILYVKEYSYPDLVSKYGGKLRFDFAIVNTGNEIVALIEYDGEFHYDKSYMFNFKDRDKAFEDVQDSDNRKNMYARNNNIPLLRIRYSRDVSVILKRLEDFLCNLGFSFKERSIYD